MIKPMEQFIYRMLGMASTRLRAAIMCTALDLAFFSPSANFAILFGMRVAKTGEIIENAKECNVRVIEAMFRAM